MRSKNSIFINIRLETLLLLFMVFSILAVYTQVRGFQFFIFDDNVYVTDNTRVQNGLTLDNIRWAFFSLEFSNWHPITWLSHMLDVRLYGMDPGGHHFTNVLFHIMSSLLLFIIFKRITGMIWQSGFVAVLFALHPMHVESVAWIAERKDVISTFFWMLTIWFYIRYVERSTIYRYMVVILFYVLGLMSKPMVVTLPFVLILLDYWPLKRFVLKRGRENHSQQEQIFKPAFIYEKIPIFVLAIIASIITYAAQSRGGAVISIDKIPVAGRIINAVISYILYLYKMIIPLDMAVFYPYPNNLSYSLFLIAIILILLITLFVLRLSVRYPYLIVGWLWYLGTLLPVIGIIQIGNQARADRYTYIPYIGLFIMASWGISTLLLRYRFRETIIAFFAGAYLMTLGSIAWAQTNYWSESIRLFRHTISVTKNNSIAHNNLGSLYAMNNKMDKAIYHFSEALKMDPKSELAGNNLARALIITGRVKKGILQYEKVLKYHPENVTAVKNLAFAYNSNNENKTALLYFKKWSKLRPHNPKPYYYIAAAYAGMNKTNESIIWLKKAIDNGYNVELIKTDNSLKRIRETDAFKKIINERTN